MSTTYRISRNIEASLIDYINAQLALATWTGITVEKTFSKCYDCDVPIICVRLGNTVFERAEIGSGLIFRYPQILIDIFGSSDGNRLDLKDFLISILKVSFPYYTYIINNGVVTTKTQDGLISVKSIRDTVVNLDVNKDQLNKQDRYRHLISLEVSRSKIE